MPFLTLFSTPKPFMDPHIAMIQKNAIESWKQLGDDIEITLIGDEPGVKKAAKDQDVSYFPNVARNAQGTPLLSSIFQIASHANSSPLLAYVNADIILFPDFFEVARQIYEKVQRFLIVGQRWDLNVQGLIDYSMDWQQDLILELKKIGRRHPPMGSDYFIFPRGCFEILPDFAVGRAGWDNWMIFKARWENWKVIDASESIMVIHQDHDYRHLPNGQTHYRLAESKQNVQLAGGRKTIFTLADANWKFQKGMLSRKMVSVKSILRAVEIWPLIKLHSFALAKISNLFFHPAKAYQEFRNRFGEDTHKT